VQGPYPSDDGRCSPSHSLLSQPAGHSVYLPKPQVRLWGRNDLSTVTVSSSASPNVHAVGVWSSASLLVVSVGHLAHGCPLHTQQLLLTPRMKEALGRFWPRLPSWQVCPKGAFGQRWPLALTPAFRPLVLFSVLHQLIVIHQRQVWTDVENSVSQKEVVRMLAQKD